MKKNKSKKAVFNAKIDKMIVQGEIDEQKINFIRDHMKRRPANTAFTQPLPRRSQKPRLTFQPTNTSSDEVSSLVNQSNNRRDQPSRQQIPPITKDIEILPPTPTPSTNKNQYIEPTQQETDLASVVSTELPNADKKSKRNKLKLRRSHQQDTSKFEQYRLKNFHFDIINFIVNYCRSFELVKITKR